MCADRGWRMSRMRNDMKLIVGLGNPGKEYEGTRHNAGFLAVDAFADQLGAAWADDTKRKAETTKALLGSETILLAKPTTYMNRSGEALQMLVSFYKIAPQDLLVVHDDMDLEPGRMQFKRDGGAAGHHGVQDILERLGTDRVNRLRIGIGRPEQAQIPSEDWVLGKLSTEQSPNLLDTSFAMRDWIEEGVETAANRWN